jgi:hypothetical protein
MAAAPVVLNTGVSRNISSRSALKLGIENVKSEGRVLGRRELQRRRDAEAILLVCVLVVARNTRPEGVVYLSQRRTAGIGRVERAKLVVGGGSGVLPAYRAGAFVKQVAFGVRQRKQCAELSVAPGIADQERGARIGFFAEIVVADLCGAGDRNPSKSNGRPVSRSTVAPSEPSSVSAAAVFRTVMLLNSSDAKVLKSKLRPRLVPPAASVPPLALMASIPLMRTRVNCGPRPRTEIWRPSPASRAIDDARHTLQRFGEVQIRKISDVFSHDHVDRADLALLGVERLVEAARKPVTTTSSTASASSAEAADAPFWATAVLATLNSAVAIASLTAREISAFFPRICFDSDMVRPS